MPARSLYLVRHAEVVVSEDVPAAEWPLSEEGRRDADRLGSASVWRSVPLVASSPEPKALATAEPIAAACGRPVRVEDDLREVRRSATWTIGAERYKALVARFFSDPTGVPGWEPAGAARQRVVACIDRLVGLTHGSLAVVSHGLLLSLYVAALSGRAAPSVDEWQSIPLPGVAVVDLVPPRRASAFASVDDFLARSG